MSKSTRARECLQALPGSSIASKHERQSSHRAVLLLRVPEKSSSCRHFGVIGRF